MFQAPVITWTAAAPILRPYASLPRPCRTDRGIPLPLQSIPREPSCCVGRTGPFRTRASRRLCLESVARSYPASEFRHIQLGVHEQREFKRPANGQHILFREDQLAGPLPAATQLSFLVHAGHVV